MGGRGFGDEMRRYCGGRAVEKKKPTVNFVHKNLRVNIFAHLSIYIWFISKQLK